MAWGISPRKTAVIPLNNYNAEHYLTLLYHAFNNLGWHIGYINHDGIIGYTNISWQSHAEEISVRIIDNCAYIKSECVGYQFFFYDYEKNEKNLELLYIEIPYVEFHLQEHLQISADELIASIPDNQFINLTDPPLGYKEKLKGFLSVFTPKPGYSVTPVLVLTNIAVFIITMVFLIARAIAMVIVAQQKHTGYIAGIHWEELYLSVGFSSREQVLNGQVWRLLSSTFLHFSTMHIAGNMIVLIYIGSLIESKLGRWNYLFIYLAAGICASVTSVVWHYDSIMAGASGAIFGLFGVLLALLSTNFYEKNARRALLISTAIFVAYSIMPLGRKVDHAAHFGGLVAGYIFGLLAYWGLKHQKQGFIIASATVLTVIYTACCVWVSPAYQLKEMRQLTWQTDKLSAQMANIFYRTENLDHNKRLHLLRAEGLSRLDTLKGIATKLNTLILPKKEMQIIHVRAKIITLECRMYDLLYKEFAEGNSTLYRREIFDDTQKINDLRLEWGKIAND